jgi:hypothetical protein
MQPGALVRSRGFCPAESFVCSGYPVFDRRGAHPARSLAACFTLPTLRQHRALGSLMPKTVETARQRFPTRPISLSFSSWRLIANNSLLPPLSIRYAIATRALLEPSGTLKLRRRAKHHSKNPRFYRLAYRKKLWPSVLKRSAPSCTDIWSVYIGRQPCAKVPTQVRSPAPDPSP